MRAFLAQSVERAAFNRKVVGSRPTGGVFLEKKEVGQIRKEKRNGYNKRAHSSVVEHRTAVPVVIGSNPIVPFLFFKKKLKKKKRENKESDK